MGPICLQPITPSLDIMQLQSPGGGWWSNEIPLPGRGISLGGVNPMGYNDSTILSLNQGVINLRNTRSCSHNYYEKATYKEFQPAHKAYLSNKIRLNNRLTQPPKYSIF